MITYSKFLTKSTALIDCLATKNEETSKNARKLCLKMKKKKSKGTALWVMFSTLIVGHI